MKTRFVLSLVGMICILAVGAFADIFIIESFENNTDPAAWQEVSPEGQTQNATNSAAPSSYETVHVTEGTYSGRFDFPWIVPGTAAGANSYISGGPTLYWSMRINIATPSGLVTPSVPNNSIIYADIYNNTADTVQIAFCVLDGAGGLERSPFKPLAPNSSTTISWNMSTETPTSFITGNGTLDGSSSTFRGIFVYTETQPTAGTFSMDVDYVRAEAQSDVTPPAVPSLLAAEQGSAPGKLRLTWAANTEPDMKEYKVYLGGDEHFGVPIVNRLALPAAPAAVVTHPTTTVEIDVATSGPVYVRLTAVDNAMPINNESISGPTLGVSLRSDGAKPDDLVVLDLNRYTPDSQPFTVDCYAHLVVYNAHALDDLGRYFESCSAAAVENNTVALAVNPDGVVIWANARDGEANLTQTITDGNIGKLTPFVAGGGNLLMSGSGVGEGLATNGSPAAQAFFASTLRASLVSDNINSGDITGGIAPFAAIGTFNTTADIFNLAAGATTDNESLAAVGSGATAVLAYGVGGNAAVVSNNRVVLFGFPFETVRDNAAATFAGARAIRAALLDASIDYLLVPEALGVQSIWQVYE